MQALTPAMEGWRKRIGRIAANFEAANKDIVTKDEGQQQSGPPQVCTCSIELTNFHCHHRLPNMCRQFC